MSDSDLLHRFVRTGDQRAFAEITRRYLDLVYHAARRRLNGDTHLAEDVTQDVFVDLARKAPTLLHHKCLAGWLYACTRFSVNNTIRRDQRRSAREKEASVMQPENRENPDWTEIHPVIDQALDELDERDRQFIILRFFGQQSFGDIAGQFGVTDNAVQKAVDRALDVLNAALSKRGVTSTAAGLAIALSRSGAAAPSSLLSSVTAAVAATAPSGAIVGTTVGAVAALKLAAALAAAAGLACAAGYWTGVQHQIVADATDSRDRDAATAARLRRLTQRIQAESDRAATAEADTATLLKAIAQAKVNREKAESTENAAIAAGIPSPAAQPGTFYAVQPRDTFAKISRAYGITVQQLAAANPNFNPARMRVGQLIVLPRGAALVDPKGRAGADTH